MATDLPDESGIGLNAGQSRAIAVGKPQRRWWRWVWRSAVILAVAAGAVGVVCQGIELRRQVFEQTKSVRFSADITRGYERGCRAATEGYFNLYENYVAEQWQQGNEQYEMDYDPLRLAVMTCWAKASAKGFPDAFKTQTWIEGKGSFELSTPVMNFNTGSELVACAAAFGIVVIWSRREYRRPREPLRGSLAGLIARRVPVKWGQWMRQRLAGCMPPSIRRTDPTPAAPFFAGWLRGVIAMLLLWYSPAMLISARGWPIWDQWVMPFYLLAILFASLDWWFVSGVALGVGAMFKGQQTFVAAVFILWPLFVGSPRIIRTCLLPAVGGLALRSFLGAGLKDHFWSATSEISLYVAVIGIIATAVVALFTGRIGQAISWVIGFVFAAMLVVSPWLVRDGPLRIKYWADHGMTMQTQRNLYGDFAASHPFFLPYESGTRYWATIHWPALYWVIEAVGVAMGILLLVMLWRGLKYLLSPSPCTQGEGGGEGSLCNFKFEISNPKLPSPQPSPGVPGEGVKGDGMVAITLAMIFALGSLAWLAYQSPPTVPGELPGTLAVIGLGITISVLAVCLPMRHYVLVIAVAAAAALALCIPFFDPSLAWYELGYRFPTWHWQQVAVGAACNLPAILRASWGMYSLTYIAWIIPPHTFGSWPGAAYPVTLKELMVSLYAALLPLTAAGMALQARRNSRRFLVALVTPWLLMYCLPTQIHERYLLFAAGAAAVCIGYRLGPALLGVFLSLVCAANILTVLIATRQSHSRPKNPWLDFHDWRVLDRVIAPIQPYISWAVLLCALMFLYMSLTAGDVPAWRKRQPQALPKAK